MTDANNIFSSLDAPFRNFEKAVEPIVWQSSDILVMQTYDLKVPTLAGSTVKYSFSTKLGDISFTTEFHAAGQVSYFFAAAGTTVLTSKFWYLQFHSLPKLLSRPCACLVTSKTSRERSSLRLTEPLSFSSITSSHGSTQSSSPIPSICSRFVLNPTALTSHKCLQLKLYLNVHLIYAVISRRSHSPTRIACVRVTACCKPPWRTRARPTCA